MSLELLIIVCVAAIVATAAAGAVTGTRTRDPKAPRFSRRRTGTVPQHWARRSVEHPHIGTAPEGLTLVVGTR